MRRFLSSLSGVVVLLLLSLALMGNARQADWQHMQVTATAYNSVPQQTDANPALAAWGDILKPGMQAIAVSRDLIRQGLDYGTQVKIEGLDGTYVVRDKMHSRWEEKIDIYMGKNVEAALEWGVKENIRISWQAESARGT